MAALVRNGIGFAQDSVVSKPYYENKITFLFSRNETTGIMGNVFARSEEFNVTPPFEGKPTFDPLDGFPQGRKKRVMIATEDEMIAAKLKIKERDYCAHLILKLEQCRVDKFPWVVRCAAEKHAWDQCQYDDYVLRMKEYERERRLLERQKRKQQATAA